MSSKQLPCSRRSISRILCAVLICLSQTLLMWLAVGGLNFQSICSWWSLSVISLWYILLIASHSSHFCTTKLSSVLSRYRTAMGNETAKYMYIKKAVCLEWVGDLNVNHSAYKTCKQRSISFVFIVTFFPKVWTKIIHRDEHVGEGQCWGHSVLWQISHLMILRCVLISPACDTTGNQLMYCRVSFDNWAIFRVFKSQGFQ